MLHHIKYSFEKLRSHLFFSWIEKVKHFDIFYLTESNPLILINITKLNIDNKFTLIILVDINRLPLIEWKKVWYFDIFYSIKK